MYVRKRLDIGWADLVFAAAASMVPIDREEAARRVEHRLSAGGGIVACLSVRSGLDLVLQALALPAGSEIIVSAVTIPHVPEIIRHHGLVPIPVDMDMERLAVDRAALEAAVGSRTRAVLVAHLFGSRMSLDPVTVAARSHGLVVIEDCAQVFAGPAYVGHPDADVAMFSFGTIKTATALGGALMRVKDQRLLARIRELQESYAVQRRRRFLLRTCKVAVLVAVSGPRGYRAFVTVLRALGRDHDAVVLRATRGFAGPGLLRRIRMRPCGPLLLLLDRRLGRFRPAEIEARAAVGDRFASLLASSCERPGRQATNHTHWLYPVSTETPAALVDRLHSAGFDATRGGTSLCVVGPPDDRPAPVRARYVMARLVYLPVYPELPERALRELASIVSTSAPQLHGARGKAA